MLSTCSLACAKIAPLVGLHLFESKHLYSRFSDFTVFQSKVDALKSNPYCVISFFVGTGVSSLDAIPKKKHNVPVPPKINVYRNPLLKKCNICLDFPYTHYAEKIVTWRLSHCPWLRWRLRWRRPAVGMMISEKVIPIKVHLSAIIQVGHSCIILGQ